IGPGCLLKDTSVGPEAMLLYAVCESAEVGPGATIGPFARLRPGTRISAGAHIGTFVELKNSTVGEGAKVPHLSYVGDADIGERANIGAATIFANYDGMAKHHTTVGAHVFTGSDTVLVEPVPMTLVPATPVPAKPVSVRPDPAKPAPVKPASAAKGRRHDADGREEDGARLRARLPRAGRRGGVVPGHQADADQALR